MKIPEARAALDTERSALQSREEAWDVNSAREKQDVLDEANSKGEVHIANVMDLCHTKKSQLSDELRRYEGRISGKGDVIKDETDQYAVFCEQGTSASDISTAKLLDMVSRLPGCTEELSDAIRAFPTSAL